MIKSNPSFSKRWHSPRRALRSRSRGSRWLRFTLILALIIGAFRFYERCKTYRTAMAIKYSPTIFNKLTSQEEAMTQNPRWQWNSTHNPSTNFDRRKLLARRQDWERLGGGFEGEVFRFENHVVKIFKEDNAPFRNCVPGEHKQSPPLRWPAEIPVSLILGGMRTSISNTSDFLPVVDYFLSPGTTTTRSKWHFITPFLPLGTLTKLAERLRDDDDDDTSHHLPTTDELDVIFRPSLNKLLLALDHMHSVHDLCHDDIKLDNIFLGSSIDSHPLETTHWILGDMGNARQAGHGYHVLPSSLVWTSGYGDDGGMGNLPDCRMNDILRMVKVYVQFLRRAAAVGGEEEQRFDRGFLEARKPWSRLFWRVWEEARRKRRLSGREVVGMEPPVRVSEEEDGTGRDRVRERVMNSSRYLFGERWMLARRVERTLRTKTSEDVARRWGLVALLGVPFSKCE